MGGAVVATKKGKSLNGILIVFTACLAIAVLAGCAYVTKGYQLYPLGVSVKTNSAKSIYIQPAGDKRVNNVKATMFFGKDKPVKCITRFNETSYFIEDPSVQTVSEFFTGAVRNDFRDAGYKIANSKNSADYVLMLQVNKMDGYKEAPLLNQILGIFTFGLLFKYDVVTCADFNAYLLDARTNRKILAKRYKSEEKIEEYLYDVYVYHTDYYLTKQIKVSVKKLLADTVRMAR
jgi:hypothetical protein